MVTASAALVDFDTEAWDNCLMFFELTGIRKRCDRELISDAFHFFATTLLHRRTVEILELSVVVKDLGHAHGFCSWEDNNINPREFTIELNKNLSGIELIKTIAHEMVHLKQFVKGELKERYRPSHRHIWYGDIIDVGDDNFYDVPWEVEARDMEQELFLLFEDKMGDKWQHNLLF